MGFNISGFLADHINLIEFEFLSMIIKGLDHRHLADFFAAYDTS